MKKTIVFIFLLITAIAKAYCQTDKPRFFSAGKTFTNPDGNLPDPGNWSKKGPAFSGNSDVYGVGHCSFVKSPDYSEDWIIYLSKKSTTPGWKRDVRMQPFTWNSNGIPEFGAPVPAGNRIKIPSGEAE